MALKELRFGIEQAARRMLLVEVLWRFAAVPRERRVAIGLAAETGLLAVVSWKVAVE